MEMSPSALSEVDAVDVDARCRPAVRIRQHSSFDDIIQHTSAYVLVLLHMFVTYYWQCRSIRTHVSRRDASKQDRSTPQETTPPFINILEALHPNKIRKCRPEKDK
jgi:hypothetical protein